MSLNGKLVDTDIYKTILHGEAGQGGEIIKLKGNAIDDLFRFMPIGYGRYATTIFRGDGTVEIYGMTPFEKESE